MSLLPYLLNAARVDPFDDLMLDPFRYSRPSFDHHFGLGINPRNYGLVLDNPRLLRQGLAELQKESEGAIKTMGKEGFQVSLDVQQFKPNEITVKMVDNNTVLIEGNHEERQDDHGYISRHFVRKYQLPKEVDANLLVSSLSSDGILTIKAPKNVILEGKKERVIQIQETGPARNSIKPNEEAQKNADKK